jgi:isoaspartyl peptidase/L-asparaginase-like protein (Ntn-hydrolase superfamily)
MRGDTLACGSVAALRDTLHPVSVARAVMEHTPHVLLVGEGALAFARARGFPAQELLTPETREAWEQWRARQAPAPAPADTHDTLGLVVFDRGRFAMAVTTSGAAWKLPGRVGDSPIVGAGGYCDDEAGACVATGLGEEMIRTCASHAVVEAMRRGAGPQEACLEVLERLQQRGRGGFSVALVACDRRGRVAGCANHAGFEYAVTDASGTTVRPGLRLRAS